MYVADKSHDDELLSEIDDDLDSSYMIAAGSELHTATANG